MTTQINSERRPFRIPWWLGWVLMAGIALFFLWEEHEAHILGALPWLLLLACPLIHLFMHGGHGHAGGASVGDHADEAPKPTTGHSQHRAGRS